MKSNKQGNAPTNNGLNGYDVAEKNALKTIKELRKYVGTIHLIPEQERDFKQGEYAYKLLKLEQDVKVLIDGLKEYKKEAANEN